MAKYKDNANEHVNVEFMRSLVKQYSDLNLWSAALFWADKVLSASLVDGGNDVWLVAKCLLQMGEYHRASNIVTSRGLHKTHLLCHYVAISALLEAKEYQQALQMLNDSDHDDMEHNMDSMPHNRVLASIYVALAVCHTALESRGAAQEALATALRLDVYCYAALHMLLQQHTNTYKQDLELLDSLPLEEQCSPAESAIISQVYRCCINRYSNNQIEEKKTPQHNTRGSANWNTEVSHIMKRSMDVKLARCRQLVWSCSWEAGLRELEQLGTWGGKCERIACLVELKSIERLFHYAHMLVDKYPDDAVSWFAVGCYYFTIAKNEFARRYLSKAKSLDPSMGEAWLAYGHSFAADNEHDQAMAAYFKASQLMPGCHLPYLYISIECSLLNNFTMADKFIGKAAGLDEDSNIIKPDGMENDVPSEISVLASESCLTLNVDPHVSHEGGCIAYIMKNYTDAEKLFTKALADVKKANDGKVPSRWFVLLDNLGHSCRKNGRIQDALGHHEAAMTCRPNRAQGYASLGLCHAMLGNTERAIHLFHSALSKSPDDAVSLTMLTYLIDEFTDIGENDIDNVPALEFPALVDIPLPSRYEEMSVSNMDATRLSDLSMSFD